MKQYSCKSKGELNRKLLYKHAGMACRACLEAMQVYSDQTDSGKYGWASAYNASYAAGSLFLKSCKASPVVAETLPAGFAQEVVSCWLRDSISSWVSWKSAIKNEFLRWRDSYGKEKPSLLEITASPKLMAEFKEVMCVESTFSSGWALEKQLDFLFKDRSKRDIKDFQIAQIPLAIRHRKGSRLALLNCPVATSASARSVDCCEASTSATVCYGVGGGSSIQSTKTSM